MWNHQCSPFRHHNLFIEFLCSHIFVKVWWRKIYLGSLWQQISFCSRWKKYNTMKALCQYIATELMTMMVVLQMMMMTMAMMMMMTITMSSSRCHRMKGSMAHQAGTASYTHQGIYAYCHYHDDDDGTQEMIILIMIINQCIHAYCHYDDDDDNGPQNRAMHSCIYHDDDGTQKSDNLRPFCEVYCFSEIVDFYFNVLNSFFTAVLAIT